MSENKEKRPLNAEEVLAKAKEVGVELTDEQLEQISGGWSLDDDYFFCEGCGYMVICKPGLEYVTCSYCGTKNGPFAID